MGFGYLRAPKGDKSPGFYPDPLGNTTLRWWDGSNWTTHVRPMSEPLSAAGESEPTFQPGESKPAPQPGESKSTPRPPVRLGAIFGSAFRLYRRYPLLFLILAAAVTVPWDLIVLAATGVGPYTHRPTGLVGSLVLGVAEWVVIAPLISALHVRAVADVRAGREPRLRPVAIRGLRALPVVAAAVIMSTLGMVLGLAALIVPGVILYFRWFFVAQVAAIDQKGWLPALRRSRQLTAGYYGDIFLFLIFLAVIGGIAIGSVQIGFGTHSTSAGAILTGFAVHIFAASVAALTTALFYFELVEGREASRSSEHSVA